MRKRIRCRSAMPSRFAAVLMALAALAVAGPASAAIRLGVVAPTGEQSFAMLGDQLRQGVETYQKANGAPFAAIVQASETCDAGSGESAARQMAAAKVDAVVGFLCPESLHAALPILAKAGIVTIGTSVRADIIMEEALKNGWPFYRFAPHWDGEVRKIVDVIAHQWAGQPFAIVEDGTIYGRELAESVRVGLEAMGITPAFIDTYRPAQDKQFGLAHRLQRSGATHVFIGGDRSDIAIIARDCAALGLKLTFMGGDSMKAADGDVPLEDGVLAVMTPAPETLPSAGTAIAALKAQGLPPYGDRIKGYAAAELVDEAEKAAGKSGKKLSAVLASQSFKTPFGPVQFTDKHELADSPFELMIWKGDGFVPAGSSTTSSAN